MSIKHYYPPHSPHEWTRLTYGVTVQNTPKPDCRPILSTKETNLILQIARTFLYYGQAVDPTIVMALKKIGANQALPTPQQHTKSLNSLVMQQPTPAQLSLILLWTWCSICSDTSYLSAPGISSFVQEETLTLIHSYFLNLHGIAFADDFLARKSEYPTKKK